MENFSTTRVALLPRVANLVTLAVVVTATWWSSAQRPPEQTHLIATQTAAARPALPKQPAAEPALGATGSSLHWPVQATTVVPRDGLQAVGYQQPRTPR